MRIHPWMVVLLWLWPTQGGATEPPVSESAPLTRQAVLGALGEVSGSTHRISGSLSQLKAHPKGIGGRANGVFIRYVVHGEQQLRWVHTAIDGATTLVHAASEVKDPDMELALLRLTGPRLEAAMSGSLLLAAWLDFLNLTDLVLRQCPSCSVERLVWKIDSVRKRLEPSMAALSSLETGQVEATATVLPELMGQLNREFNELGEAVRAEAEGAQKTLLVAQSIEMATSILAMRLSLPRLPPAAPAPLGVGVMMGPDGVMMGTRMVVSAEWVEMMRRLVRAGVISLPVVSAAVRIQAGQVMRSQRHDELPRGVREALGDGPEVQAMHPTGKTGAGMAEPPRHHVLPREQREWFEKRGFTGDMSIDQFCVKLEPAKHQAIHGGGNWRLGRTWAGEWNRMIMKALRDAETDAGRMLTRTEILDIVAAAMRRDKIPIHFTPWNGR